MIKEKENAMNILTMNEITKSYGERKLFDKACFSLMEGEKVGIVGRNGMGKSTLLKMIADLEETDEGSVIKANHVHFCFLPQNPQFVEAHNVLEAVMEAAPKQCSESEAKSMLTKLGVTDFLAKCKQLSGGQKKRLALVSVLLSNAELLILDEPTNHLDAKMAEWLEENLKKRKGAVIMVTHDRYFLDRVSNRIVEIDKGTIYSYEGNYSKFLSLKLQREEMEEASDRKRKTLLKIELEWVKRGARARSTKQKARLERFDQLKEMTGITKPETIQLNSLSRRLGKTTVELQGVSKSYGDNQLIENFEYIFSREDRVGFIGKNGCGKSTLLKIINQSLMPDQGNIIIGQTVKIGYFAQEIGEDAMNPEQRVIEYIRDIAEFIETSEGKISASKMLETFLFSGEEQYSFLGKLSGGEKRRLYLLRVLMEAPNVLLLDEPTNDFDIETLQVLEEYLDHFQGIVVIVSHDRYFLDRTVSRIFSFEEDGKLVQSEGGYTDYALRKKEQEERKSLYEKEKHKEKTRIDKENWKSTQTQKLKFTFQEKKEYESIEMEMEELEEKIEMAEAKLSMFAKDFVKLNEIIKEKENLQQCFAEKMERWIYLEELAQRIDKGEEVVRK